MHHLIEEMILSFTREELREFKYFLKGRANMVQEREDVRLVDAIRKKIPSSSQSSNAYHQTRKRLKRQLEERALQGSMELFGKGGKIGT